MLFNSKTAVAEGTARATEVTAAAAAQEVEKNRLTKELALKVEEVEKARVEAEEAKAAQTAAEERAKTAQEESVRIKV
jgi:hypothetical protein